MREKLQMKMMERRSGLTSVRDIVDCLLPVETVDLVDLTPSSLRGDCLMGFDFVSVPPVSVECLELSKLTFLSLGGQSTRGGEDSC